MRVLYMMHDSFSHEYAFMSFDDLSQKYRKLLMSANGAMKNYYDPYKNNMIGASVLTESGKMISAANVNNSSSINSTCAERSAVAKANSMGERRFRAVAVMGKPGNGKNYTITPCGSCRQVIYEFARYSKRDLDVIMSNGTMDKIIVLKISELLPLAYR